jgi:ABC-2 type transport system ATP-binding protein
MIEVQDLTKYYGGVKAVDGVSFRVDRRRVLGFLGPNGAGKTTIMRVLAGCHFPGGGSVVVDGIPVTEDPVELKRRIGYLPETAPLYGELTVEEYLNFIAGARLIPRSRRRAALDLSMEACGLSGCRFRRIETLSRGFRQRIGLAQAILHDPPILILDEPAAGLDPNQVIEFRSLIRELGKRKTVILSTHILRELEAVADQVLILNRGKIAAQGRPEEITAAMRGGNTWELCLKGDAIPARLARLGWDYTNLRIGDAGGAGGNGAAGGSNGGGGEGGDAGGEGGNGALRVSFFVPGPGGADGEPIFDWAVREGIKILTMNRRSLSLEDLFVQLTSGRDPEAGREGRGAGGRNR